MFYTKTDVLIVEKKYQKNIFY